MATKKVKFLDNTFRVDYNVSPSNGSKLQQKAPDLRVIIATSITINNSENLLGCFSSYAISAIEDAIKQDLLSALHAREFESIISEADDVLAR